MGAERGFVPRSEDHAAYWTTRYDSRAVFTMADAQRAGRRARVDVPSFVALCEEDRVISPDAARRAATYWTGPVTWHRVSMGPGDDPGGHIIAGDIGSPGQTAPLARAMIDWLAGLPE